MTLIGQLLRKAHPQLPDSDGPAVRAQLDGIAQLCRDRLRQQEAESDGGGGGAPSATGREEQSRTVQALNHTLFERLQFGVAQQADFYEPASSHLRSASAPPLSPALPLRPSPRPERPFAALSPVQHSVSTPLPSVSLTAARPLLGDALGVMAGAGQTTRQPHLTWRGVPGGGGAAGAGADGYQHAAAVPAAAAAGWSRRAHERARVRRRGGARQAAVGGGLSPEARAARPSTRLPVAAHLVAGSSPSASWSLPLSPSAFWSVCFLDVAHDHIHCVCLYTPRSP